MKAVFSQFAFKQFSKLEKEAQKRIAEKLEFYLSQKDPLKFSEKLSDSKFGDRRFRIGNHRILFDVDGSNINILKIGDRKDIYK
ncbi:MAG: type II toxin-antitoxin system RelE/ParE family toxin [Candidatus Paceibacterota bacterium]